MTRHGMERCERLAILVSLKAPIKLLVNEAKLLLRENEEDDLTWGVLRGVVRWRSLAIWSLVCLCKQNADEIVKLKRQVRELKKHAKKSTQEAPQ
jgi:hypothetical protein